MTRTTLSLTALACAAMVVAGCGGSSSSPGVAHLSSGSASNSSATVGGSTHQGGSSTSEGRPTQQQMVAFSQCMRSHGVPDFPEPTEGKLLIHSSDRNGRLSGIDPRSAQFQAARKVCGKLLPNGGVPSPAERAKIQEAALKFSQCMRTHGVPSFPDPEFSHGGGAVRLQIGKGGPGGIDPNSPQFQVAQKACQSLMPGPKGGPGAGGNIGIGIGGPKGG